MSVRDKIEAATGCRCTEEQVVDFVTDAIAAVRAWHASEHSDGEEDVTVNALSDLYVGADALGFLEWEGF